MRQRNIFKPRRVVTPRPRTSEFELQCQVADALRLNCHPHWRWTHLPMGEKRDPVTAMRLKRMGVTPGWPDFMFIHWLSGRMLWLELKRPSIKAVPSATQEELARFIGDCDGHTYICCNDLEMALDLLRDHGITSVRVSV